jgi:hypothetical protein
MPENSRRGVAVVQWQIVDLSRSMSWDYFLANIPDDRWHGPADVARLSYSLQRGWLGGARGPAPAWAPAASGRSPAERSGEVGGRRP